MAQMSFALSQRSISRMSGVRPELIQVVSAAIEISTVDFGVTEGLRTIETQRMYVQAGKSRTMDSKHLTGHAVDLVAYVNGTVSWELDLYDNIADAVKQAAIEKNVAIRWGAAWNVPDIRLWRGTMEEAMNFYIDERRKQNRRPFIDGPHFEMV
jgi:peptidoglycan L-alanyl-D-glutamate endopeptidase CwlK